MQSAPAGPVTGLVDYDFTGEFMAAKVSKTRKAKRSYSLRADSKIGPARKRIARVFGLPPECIRLILPSGRAARSDKHVFELLRDWGY